MFWFFFFSIVSCTLWPSPSVAQPLGELLPAMRQKLQTSSSVSGDDSVEGEDCSFSSGIIHCLRLLAAVFLLLLFLSYWTNHQHCVGVARRLLLFLHHCFLLWRFISSFRQVQDGRFVSKGFGCWIASCNPGRIFDCLPQGWANREENYAMGYIGNMVSFLLKWLNTLKQKMNYGWYFIADRLWI